MSATIRLARVWRVTVGVLAAAVGVNLGTPVIAAAALRGALTRSLQAGGVEARVEAWPPPAPWWGHADLLSVAARDLRLGDLRVETFTATLDRVWFDPAALYVRHTLVVRSVGFGIAHATVSQDALAHAVALQPDIRVDSVVLRRGRVILRGAGRLLGVEVPVEAEGRLVLNPSAGVDLILDRITVSGGTLAVPPGGLVRSIIAVPSLPFGLRLRAVTVGDGRLILDAATGSP